MLQLKRRGEFFTFWKLKETCLFCTFPSWIDAWRQSHCSLHFLLTIEPGRPVRSPSGLDLGLKMVVTDWMCVPLNPRKFICGSPNLQLDGLRREHLLEVIRVISGHAMGSPWWNSCPYKMSRRPQSSLSPSREDTGQRWHPESQTLVATVGSRGAWQHVRHPHSVLL